MKDKTINPIITLLKEKKETLIFENQIFRYEKNSEPEGSYMHQYFTDLIHDNKQMIKSVTAALKVLKNHQAQTSKTITQ